VVAVDGTRVPRRSWGKTGRCRFFGTDGSGTHPQRKRRTGSWHAMGSPVGRVLRSTLYPAAMGKSARCRLHILLVDKRCVAADQRLRGIAISRPPLIPIERS
jgi:hypothetical protein